MVVEVPVIQICTKMSILRLFLYKTLLYSTLHQKPVMTSQFTQLGAWIQQGLQRFHWVIRMLWQHFPSYFMCLIWLVQVPFPPPLVYGSLERNKQLAEKRDGRKGGTLWSPAEMLDQVFVLFSFLRWIRVRSWCSVFCSLKLMWKCSTLGLRNTVSQSVVQI